MAATSDSEQRIGAEMLDRAQFDGVLIPRTAQVDTDLVTEFRREVRENSNITPVAEVEADDTGPAAASSSTSGGGRGGDSSSISFEDGYDDLVAPRDVTAVNYAGQIASRRASAREKFRDMLVRTGGVVTRRSLAYFLGLGLNDVMVDNNPVSEPTVLAMLCQNANVSAASVRLAASMLDDVDFDAASEATGNLTPLGLAIMSAVRAQESDSKMQTFGDNAVEKVRVLLEHEAWVCQMPEENSRSGEIAMPEFLERLESGRGTVEILDLVAKDKLKTIADVQKAKRDMFMKEQGGLGSAQFEKSSDARQGQAAIIRTHNIEQNPVFIAFSNAVSGGHLASFFNLLNTKREWDVHVDSVDNQYRLPVIWLILKHLTYLASLQSIMINDVPTGVDREYTLICPAFDMLLSWYLARKSASNAFKFDSLACVFWYCVGAWRRLGANDYDTDIDESSPFPLMDLPAPGMRTMIDDPYNFTGDFFYNADDVRTMSKALGLPETEIAAREARVTLSSDLQGITNLLETPNFIKFLENSVTKLNNLNIPQGIATLRMNNATIGEVARQSGLNMDSIRRIRKIPGNPTFLQNSAVFRFAQYLQNALNLPAVNDNTVHDFFSDLSLQAMSKSNVAGFDKIRTLHDAIVDYRSFDFNWPGDDPPLVMLTMDDAVPFNTNGAVALLSTKIPNAGAYILAIVMTFFQYGVLEQLARLSHQNLSRAIYTVKNGIATIHTAPHDKILDHLKTMKDVLIRMAKEFMFYRIVTGAIALFLGVDSRGGKIELRWGSEIGQLSKKMANADKLVVKPALVVFDTALNNLSATLNRSQRTSIQKLRDEVQTAYHLIADSPNPATAWIGVSVTMSSVTFKLPFSADDFAPNYPTRYKAEIFKLLTSLPKTLKMHQDHIFADPSDFSSRLDARPPGDVWPLIPGEVM